MPDLDRFVELALAAVDREYPNHLAHALAGDGDVAPPRRLHPAFHGCFDWHSAVHNHWLLARAARLAPASGLAASARQVLDRHLAPEPLAAEQRYLEAAGREGFERPYGLAWLLVLAAELREWGEEAAVWAQALSGLERLAVSRLCRYFERLSHPVRSGEHGQSAFALGLLLDWARIAGDVEAGARAAQRARVFHGEDRDLPLRLEPSGHDFLSPSLAAADLMRRVLPPPEFAAWLDRALPAIALVPVASPDRADGKLAHLDGLNLSRAWMLEGVVSALPPAHPRQAALGAAAAAHREAGLAAVSGEHYAGAHWLPSFAAYLITGRGLGSGAPGDGVE